MKLKKNRVLKSYRLAASAALHFQLEEAKEDISVIDIETGIVADDIINHRRSKKMEAKMVTKKNKNRMKK